MTPAQRAQKQQVRLALGDPRKLAHVLGLLDKHSMRQAAGVIVRCPAHADGARPNLSLTAKDGTVRVKCFGCDFKGDALTLIALVHGVDTRTDFPALLALAAELSGDHLLAAELADGKPRPERRPIPQPPREPDVQWPDGVADFWGCSRDVREDPGCVALLERRGLNPDRVAELGLARAIPAHGRLPGWARYSWQSWRQTGHHLLVRAWDATGSLRSVRGWRVSVGQAPKRLPPAGCRSAGLVLADRAGWRLLAGRSAPGALWVVEGEPDWMAATLAAPVGHGVWGIGSGSWTDEHAERARACQTVIVATHADEAGDRYASAALASVPGAMRWRPPSDLDDCREALPELMRAEHAQLTYLRSLASAKTG